MLDIKRIGVDVQLPQCAALRPWKSAEIGYVMDSGLFCFFRHVEGYVNQNDVLYGMG